jgi:hypothetical protein
MGRHRKQGPTSLDGVVVPFLFCSSVGSNLPALAGAAALGGHCRTTRHDCGDQPRTATASPLATADWARAIDRGLNLVDRALTAKC